MNFLTGLRELANLLVKDPLPQQEPNYGGIIQLTPEVQKDAVSLFYGGTRYDYLKEVVVAVVNRLFLYLIMAQLCDYLRTLSGV